MFDDRLKKLRLETGLNMKQTAEKLGIPYTTYVGYEKNEREPNSEILDLIANYFNCTIDYLLGRTTKKEHKPEISDDDIKFALWGGAEGITDEMYEEVRQYAEMVKMREERKKE